MMIMFLTWKWGTWLRFQGEWLAQFQHLLDHKQQMLQKALKHQATWMWKLKLLGGIESSTNLE